MLHLQMEEAQLYRLLVDFFGRERVVPRMSILAVCGGELPEEFSDEDGGLRDWAKRNLCLFTIVDYSDEPRMVVEFFSGFGDVVDPDEVERRLRLPDLLKRSGVRYVTMSSSEFDEILDPGSRLDMFHFLKDRVEEEDEPRAETPPPPHSPSFRKAGSDSGAS